MDIKVIGIADLDRRMKDAARDSEDCRRLVEVPGIGPLIATAVTAAVCDETRFSSGRHFAAWLGLTPKQHSSGGKERLLGISKRGDAYMRRQFVNGARSLVRIANVSVAGGPQLYSLDAGFALRGGPVPGHEFIPA